MVKIILEYDEKNLTECFITNSIGDTYKSQLLYDFENLHEHLTTLKYIANELKSSIYDKLVKYKTWYIETPFSACNEVCYIQTDTTEIRDNIGCDCVEILTIDVRKFYELYTELYSDYLNNKYYDYNDIYHIFISPTDLKFISNTDDIPFKKFDVHIDNIHIHYIPNINKSFVIDNKSLYR